LRENLAQVPVYPAGRTLDAALVDTVVADLRRRDSSLSSVPCSRDNTAGVFVDLNDDNIDEFVLLHPYAGTVFENRNGAWVRIGSLVTDETASSPLKMADAALRLKRISIWRQPRIESRNSRIRLMNAHIRKRTWRELGSGNPRLLQRRSRNVAARAALEVLKCVTALPDTIFGVTRSRRPRLHPLLLSA
jgi:hypothetical protein